MVVSVSGVRQTPRDDGVELAVHRVTRLTLGAGADTAQGTGRRAPIVPVVMRVTAKTMSKYTRLPIISLSLSLSNTHTLGSLYRSLIGYVCSITGWSHTANKL